MAWWFVRSWYQQLTSVGLQWQNHDRMIYGTSNDALLQVNQDWPGVPYVYVYVWDGHSWQERRDIGRF